MGYDPIEVNQAASKAAKAVRKDGGAGYTKIKTYILDITKEPTDIFGDGNLFVHISDEEPNLVGAVLKAVGTAFPAGGTEFPVPENAIQVDVSGIRLIVDTAFGIPLVMVVPSGIDGVSKGLYFGTNEIMYPASLTTETIHPIDPKYLPGVCLPVVEIADYTELTEAECAALDKVASKNSPLVVKFNFDGIDICCALSRMNADGITVFSGAQLLLEVTWKIVLNNEGGWTMTITE